MASFPEGIGPRESLKSVLTKKSRTFDKCTALGKNSDAVALRVQALESENWERQKPRPKQKSVPMTRAKEAAVQLEDDVWCMFYRLGFDELNVDSHLTFSVDPKVIYSKIPNYGEN